MYMVTRKSPFTWDLDRTQISQDQTHKFHTQFTKTSLKCQLICSKTHLLYSWGFYISQSLMVGMKCVLKFDVLIDCVWSSFLFNEAVRKEKQNLLSTL